MILVHHRAAEPTLPEMAGALQPGVNMARITAMHRRQRAAEPVLVRRHEDEVHMIGHHHIGPDFNSRRPTMRAEQFAIERKVMVIEKCLLAAVAALGDVMGEAGKNRAGETCHMPKLRSLAGNVN